MPSIRLAGNYIAEFDDPTNPNRGQGQLQLVLHDQNNLSREIEVSRPLSNLGPSPWQITEQLHGGPTPYIGWNDAVENPNRYKQVELDLRSGTTAQGTWQLIEQITASLANQGFAIMYNQDTQNENSFVTSVLSVIGIDIDDYWLDYRPADVRVFQGFKGIETNIIQDGVESFFSPEPMVINLNLAGTNHNDYIQGGAGNDVLKGALFGFDTIKGGAGDDSITGSGQANQLLGENGDDSIDGARGNDTIWGGEGQDTLLGGGDNDIVVGGNGHDRIYGDDGTDQLFGGDGNDSIFGGSGNDYIIVGSGSDTASGGSGDDIFFDGQGNDLFHGEEGEDTFVFRSTSLNWGARNVVHDFERGIDKLAMDDITSFVGNSISSGWDADTNGDGKISAMDDGWFNSENGLIFYTDDWASIRIIMTDGVQELQYSDFF